MVPSPALPPTTPSTDHCSVPPVLDCAAKWIFCPGASATYCGVIDTEPAFTATGGGPVGALWGGGGSVPCFTPQPLPMRTAKLSASEHAIARDLFTRGTPCNFTYLGFVLTVAWSRD